MSTNDKSAGLSRRAVITRALWLTGATTVVGSNALMTAACSTNVNRSTLATASSFTATDIQWLDEVAETILPETETPGAKAAAVGAFIAIMVTDTYDPQEQQRFRSGMQQLENEAVAAFGVGFATAAPTQRTSLLQRLDEEQHTQHENDSDEAPAHYFRTIKELTVLGYFTSEIGYTQALRYVETPGRFDPCVDYTPGEKSWARHA